MLEILPDPLVRIEIGRIAGQSLQMDAMGTTCGEKVFNRLPTMNRGSIPHNQQLARNVSQDVLEKPHHVRATIGVLLHLHQQLTLRGNRADRRDMIIAQGSAQNRCLPTGSIRTCQCWQQVKASFVYPNEGSPFLLGFFLIAGHFSSRQAAMACSLRWVARSTGFCTLQPISRSSRPTWSGWYATPNVRLMTVATRARVQISPRNPQASAPLASKAG